ncbi:hypothetical protein D3C72_2030040 [compost metagenome]
MHLARAMQRLLRRRLACGRLLAQTVAHTFTVTQPRHALQHAVDLAHPHHAAAQIRIHVVLFDPRPFAKPFQRGVSLPACLRRLRHLAALPPH